MPRAVHPRRDEAVSYALANPTIPYSQVSKLYGVSESSLGVWISRVRKKDGLLAAPPRPIGKPKGNGHRAPPKPITPTIPNLVALPKPVPPPEIQEEYRAAALAAAKRMRAIASDPKLTLKDAALILELTTGTYGTVGEMEGKGKTASNAPRKLVEALLGNAPTEDSSEDEDLVLTPDSAVLSGSGK